MLEEGKSPREMRVEIDRTYADQMAYATPTPYPQA